MDDPRKITTDLVTETRLHHFVGEASTLGWPVGQVPVAIDTDLGNKMPFMLTFVDEDGTANFRQANGCITLKVFND